MPPGAEPTPASLTLERHGVTIKLRDEPGRIPQAWRNGAVYEERLLDHIYKLRLRGTALDVGANIGNHTIYLAKVCGLRVEAFEPQTVARLRANLRLNGLTPVEVRVHEVCCGATTGTAAHVGKGQFDPRTAGKARVVTIDSYDLRNVVVMKVDVEGMEPDVLRGAVDTIRRDRPRIYTEAWDDQREREIRRVLAPLGYSADAWFRHGKQGVRMREWLP